MRKDNPQIEAVKWFLDLVSLDIETLSERELSKLVIDAEHYFQRPGIPLFPLEESDCTKSLDETLLEVRATGYTNFWPDDFPWTESLMRIQERIKASLKKIIRTPDHMLYEDIKGVDLKLISFGGELRIGPVIDPKRMANPSKIAGVVNTVFMFALEGLPTDAIRKCQECDRFFLHISKKPKYYCSPSCTSRGSSRKRREKDPEEYRKKQREIMRRKYRERKARELGVSPEKVKIKKRVKD
jgi:hypothetical protein